MNYTYIGSEEVNLPTLGVTVKAGQTVSSPIAINHPEFIATEAAPITPVAQEPTEIEQAQEEVTE